MLKTFKLWSKMIKLEHSLFSLPFVLSSALLAVFRGNPDPSYSPIVFVWMSLCLVSARSAGMTLNRIFDNKIDAKNPRTQNREIPAKLISLTQAWIFAIVSLVIFIYSAFQLPSLCQILLPIALLWIWIYSWLKRITWLCHFFLGTILGGATLGGWIAVIGAIESPAPIYLALAVSFWVAGFDIIYATQDFDFDRSANLHSIPAKFGKEAAIKIARVSHFLTPLFLYLCGEELRLGLIYKLGILLTIIALYYEQKLVKANKIEEAFFTVNSWISVLILFAVLFDLLWS